MVTLNKEICLEKKNFVSLKGMAIIFISKNNTYLKLTVALNTMGCAD
jgi:hypothetical protein